MSKTYLITGIPRSGTTLCCKLLNKRQDAVALHEPIQPNAMPKVFAAEKAVVNIQQQINQFNYAIQHGLPFQHGDKGGLEIDNPVGSAQLGGIRQVVAKRGMIQLPAKCKGSFELVIKQNALFTALLPELSKCYSMICIVRNPVDVFLSWLTVDLPINRGHIPAGERFDAKLKASLVGLTKIERQLVIYQWFIDKFLASGLPIVRYEDIIDSNGAVLDEALGFEPIEREGLSPQERSFTPEALQQLSNIKYDLLQLDYGHLYSPDDILQAMHRVGIR